VAIDSLLRDAAGAYVFKDFCVLIPFIKNAGPLNVNAFDMANAAARAAVANPYALLIEVGIVESNLSNKLVVKRVHCNQDF